MIRKSAIPASVKNPTMNVGRWERVISVAGGSLLTALGARSKPAVKAALFATGGSLLFRGLTGYCPVNAGIGRDTARKKIKI